VENTERAEPGELLFPAKINRRPDSCESLDARAALPQNCSLTTLSAMIHFGNSTSVPVAPTDVLWVRKRPAGRRRVAIPLGVGG
jgi:hypothetical protein